MRQIPFPHNSQSFTTASDDHTDGATSAGAFSPRRAGRDAFSHEPVIDPALGGPSCDPMFISLTGDSSGELASEPPASPPSDQVEHPHFHFVVPDGPQGEPIFEEAIPRPGPREQSPRPMGRQRRRRPPKCQFCRGDDGMNKQGFPELMLSCCGCKKSGHPSCMELEGDPERVRAWDWKCIECKECEVCRTKGDDARILFCDVCDRGWHMDCLNPPIKMAPKGKWSCPICADVRFPSEPSSSRQVSVISETRPSYSPTYVNDELLSFMDIHTPNLHRRNKHRMMEEAVDIEEGSEGENADEDSEEQFATDHESESDQPPDSDVEGIAVEERQPNPKRGRGRPRKSDPPPPKRPPKPPKTRPKVKEKGKEKARRAQVPRVTIKASVRRGGLLIPKASSLKLKLRLPNKGASSSEPSSPKKDAFEDILSKKESDVSHTTIQQTDKNRFDRARTISENKILTAIASVDPPKATPPTLTLAHPTRNTRHLRISPLPPHLSETPASVAPSRSPKELRIKTIRFGAYDIDTWYDAPFPEEYSNLADGRLWYCENCLKYMRSKFMAGRHKTKCKMRHPPGDEIYRDGMVSIFEVDGRKHKAYCQNLCLLSKMFLDHKSLFYDVEPFLFYVIAELDEQHNAARFVGYFSKEKSSPKDYNVSCIMSLPIRQRQGWGNLLIDFSYLLSKHENRPGSPEKPLSALGEVSYKRYWTLAIMRFLALAPDNVTLENIQDHTAMTLEDIYTTLVSRNMITVRDEVLSTPSTPSNKSKLPRNRRRIKRPIAPSINPNLHTQPADHEPSPFTPPKFYRIHFDRQEVMTYLVTYERKGNLQLRPDALKWTPYLLTRQSNIPAVEAGASLAVRDAGAPATGWAEVQGGVEQPPGSPGQGASSAAGPDTPFDQNGYLDITFNGVKEEQDSSSEREEATPRASSRILRSRSNREIVPRSEEVKSHSAPGSRSRSRSPPHRSLRSRRSRNVADDVHRQSFSPRKRRRVESSPENPSDVTSPRLHEPSTPLTPMCLDTADQAPSDIAIAENAVLPCENGQIELLPVMNNKRSINVEMVALPAIHAQLDFIESESDRQQGSLDSGRTDETAVGDGGQYASADHPHIKLEQPEAVESSLDTKADYDWTNQYAHYNGMDLCDEDAEGEEDAEGVDDPDMQNWIPAG